MSLFFSCKGEHFIKHSEHTIPSLQVLSYRVSAHPTSPKYNIFYGNTWADIKKIVKSFVKPSFLSSPSLFLQPRVTEVDSSYKNIKPFFFNGSVLYNTLLGKIHYDVFNHNFNSLLSTFFYNSHRSAYKVNSQVNYDSSRRIINWVKP